MKEQSTEVVILGAGTAGLSAHRAVVEQGRSALLVDPGPLGTTGVRVGAIPSKLLIAAANAAHEARQAGVFGVHTGAVRVDGREVLARLRRERDHALGEVLQTTEQLLERGGLVRGRGRFVAKDQVQVDGPDGQRRVRFRAAVLATGSSTWTPPGYRALGDAAMTNEEVFELADLPESLLVTGTGEIGLELGQAFHRLGVRTTLVGRSGFVGPLSDPVLLAAATRVFAAELDFHPDYDLESAERTDDGVRVRFDGREELYERVLVAAGRQPQVTGLGLDLFGVDETAALPVDRETTRLAGTPVFVAGDASRFRPRFHEASHEGHIAGRNAAAYPEARPERRQVSLTIDFCSPQIAVVGRRFAELDLDATAIGAVDYAGQGRARVMNLNEGLVRIYGERVTGRLLGAEMLGPRVEHMAHLLAWAIGAELTVDQALAMPFYHPVVEEGLRTALQDLREQQGG